MMPKILSSSVSLLMFLCLLQAMGCQDSDLMVKQSEPVEEPTDQMDNPPKVVIDEPQFDFGAMEVGGKGSHEFVIRNDGTSTLTLKKDRSTCKCTIADFDELEVPPGESTTVRLDWEAKVLDTSFSQAAYIKTNDPLREEIELRVTGRVDQEFDVTPAGMWSLGEMAADKPTEFSGRVTSNVVEQLTYIGFECGNPLVKVEFTPLTAEELRDLGVKQGFAIKGRVEPGSPIGQFSETVTVKLESQGQEKFAILGLQGYYSGPMQIVGPLGWKASEMMMVLGRFSAREGKKVTLSLFVRDNSGPPIEIVELNCNPSFVKVDLVKDEKFKADNRERYELTIEIPAGSPSVAHEKENMGKILIKTNNSLVQEMSISLNMISY